MSILSMMAGVWSTSTGAKIEGEQRVRVGGGVIPEGSTGVFAIKQCALDTAKVYDKDGKEAGQDDIVKVQWKCVEGHAPDGADIANRVVFQKLRLWDEDDAKCDSARRKLASIDLIANEGHLAADEPELDNEVLGDLLDGEAFLTIGEWAQGTNKGNYVTAIGPVDDYEPFEDAAPATPARTPRNAAPAQEEKPARPARRAR